MIDRTERTASIIEHYRKGLNYADTLWLSDTLALERVFVDRIAIRRLS